MKKSASKEQCPDDTKRQNRIEKMKDIHKYLKRANEYQDELREELEREQKAPQKNKKRNRGKKSDEFFVFEKILELIKLYLQI